MLMSQTTFIRFERLRLNIFKKKSFCSLVSNLNFKLFCFYTYLLIYNIIFIEV